MDILEGLRVAVDSMQSWMFLLAFAIGCLNGIVFGMIPGLSGSVGIALMIPFTYGMPPAAAMALFVAALSGQSFSGSVTAILLNVPGSSPSAATTFDGYPLARMGKGGFAIGISAAASFFGSVIGTIVLIALFPVVRSVILAFSFPEFAMLGLLGLAAIALAARGSMLKGLISGFIGLLVSFIGFAPIGGDVRYVFGQPALFAGLDVVIVLVGMYAVAEALQLLSTNQTIARNAAEMKIGHGQVWEGVRYTARRPWLVTRSSLIGTGIGIVPAVGGTVAAFLAYFQAAKTEKNPMFGRGDPRGVLAPEASNDAKDSGAALPTLAFGIPGSADWAIILGAMIIHGVTPGPNLIQANPDIVWVAIIILIAASFVSSMSGLIFAPQLMQVTRIRPALLSPVVLMLAVVGAFALNLSVTDVLVSIGFGLFGYAMRQVGIPMIPLILGLILGPMVERSYLQTLSTFGGLSGFVTRPISAVLLASVIAIIGYEIYSARKARRTSPRSIEEGVRSAIRASSLSLIAGIGAVALIARLMAEDFSNEDSQTFPVITSNVLILLVAGYLLIALVPALRARFGGLIADGGGMEDMRTQLEEQAEELAGQKASSSEEVTEPTPPPDGQRDREFTRRLWLSVALCVGLAVGTMLIGMPATIPIVLVLFLRVVSRESWRVTAAMTVGTTLLLYLAFHQLLGVPLEGGWLLDY